MKALASLVAEDVDFINVEGTWLKGRKDFEEHHVRLHAGPFKESVWATTEVQVTFLKPDVAIVYVSWNAKGQKERDGTPQQPRPGIFMAVCWCTNVTAPHPA